MNNIKRVITCILALIMLFTLCACGGEDNDGSASLDDVKRSLLGLTADDFKVLLQGNLDEVYLGKFDPDYLSLVDCTEEECQENYEAGMEYEANFFCYYFYVEYPTEEYLAELTELYKEIYSHAKYTVGDVSKLDDETYVAKLTIAPIDIIELTVTAIEDGALDDFYNRYTEEQVEAMTDAEYEAYDQEWAQAVLAVVRGQMENIGYCQEQSLAVQFVVEDEAWIISSSDMQSIDELIIAYP